jgi:hypothetical protein
MFAHPSKKDLNFAFPASASTKAQAVSVVQVYIKQQDKKIEDMNKLVQHATKLKAARRGQSGNGIGVALSDRQILKFETLREGHERMIKNLEQLMIDIDSSEFIFNYEEKAAEIVAQRRRNSNESVTCSQKKTETEISCTRELLEI